MLKLNHEHIHTTAVGEEDGHPVHVALIRCRLFSNRTGPIDFPPDTILSWHVADETDGVGVDWVALPVGVEPPGWDPDGGMGDVFHDITWYTGHKSSSATVCDMYIGDGSVMLTIITPACLQAANIDEAGTEAYTVDT